MADDIAIHVELARFQAGAIDPAQFSHRHHLRIGFELMRRYPFTEAAHRFATGLRAMATRTGRPGLYHDTITVAFLAVIAERNASSAYGDFDAFERDNHDLLRKDALLAWYGTQRLMSPLARSTFVLPLPAGGH